MKGQLRYSHDEKDNGYCQIENDKQEDHNCDHPEAPSAHGSVYVKVQLSHNQGKHVDRGDKDVEDDDAWEKQGQHEDCCEDPMKETL